MSRFPGLMSRCSVPWACAYSSASAACWMMAAMLCQYSRPDRQGPEQRGNKLAARRVASPVAWTCVSSSSRTRSVIVNASRSRSPAADASGLPRDLPPSSCSSDECPDSPDSSNFSSINVRTRLCTSWEVRGSSPVTESSPDCEASTTFVCAWLPNSSSSPMPRISCITM